MTDTVVATKKSTKSQTPNKTDVLGIDYHVVSVTKVAAPDGADGKDWYRYVLEGGHTPITGWHSGSLAEVTEYAKSCAMELNERRAGRGVGYPRGRPAKKD